MPPIAPKLFPLLLLLIALAGCSPADLHQAEVCEAVATQLFAGSRVDRLVSETDASAAHAITTRVTLRAADGSAERHSVGCVFESANAKSADYMALATVTSDVEGTLSEARLAGLREALDRKGIPWKVSWIPTFGGPRGELAPASPAVAVLYFLQLALNGLTYGSVIALVAIGYTLIYGVIGVVNLAFGDIYMVGAFVATGVMLALAAAGIGSFGIGALLALPVAMAVTAGYSVATDRIVFRKLRRSHTQMPLVASIGLSLVLQNYVFLTGGPGNLWVTPPVAQGVALAAADGFELYANLPQAVLVGATLLLVAATWFVMTRTPFGRAQRACAQDRRMAALLGLDVDLVIAGTFGLGGALAGAGGLMAASYYGGISVVMGVMVGLKAFTAAILGGIGNFKGAILGGFAVALLESFTAGYFYGGYKEAAVFAFLILLLIFRPDGILGDA